MYERYHFFGPPGIAVIMRRQIRQVHQLDLIEIANALGIRSTTNEATSSRFVKCIHILSDEIVDDFLASFARSCSTPPKLPGAWGSWYSDSIIMSHTVCLSRAFYDEVSTVEFVVVVAVATHVACDDGLVLVLVDMVAARVAAGSVRPLPRQVFWILRCCSAARRPSTILSPGCLSR